MMAVAITCDLGTTLITGDYKFDQTPVDGRPADVSRLAELEGPARHAGRVAREVRRDPLLVDGQPARRAQRPSLLPDRAEGVVDEVREEGVVLPSRRLHGNDVPVVGTLRGGPAVGRFENAGQGGPEQLLPAGSDHRDQDSIRTLRQFVRHARTSFRDRES